MPRLDRLRTRFLNFILESAAKRLLLLLLLRLLPLLPLPPPLLLVLLWLEKYIGGAPNVSFPSLFSLLVFRTESCGKLS